MQGWHGATGPGGQPGGSLRGQQGGGTWGRPYQLSRSAAGCGLQPADLTPGWPWLQGPEQPCPVHLQDTMVPSASIRTGERSISLVARNSLPRHLRVQ